MHVSISTQEHAACLCPDAAAPAIPQRVGRHKHMTKLQGVPLVHPVALLSERDINI